MPRAACSKIAICGYVDALVTKLRRLAPVAGVGDDVDAVHDARVAARRMKGVLELIEPLVEDELIAPVSKVARRVRKRLGALRDLDVMLRHLRAISKLRGQAGAAVWLMGRLSAQRASAVKKLRKKDVAADWVGRLDGWKQLKPRVAELELPLEAAMRVSLSRQVVSFCNQADRLCSQMMDSLFEQERDPHAVRIAGKELRYTLEMMGRVGSPPAEEARKLFKRMQDALGLWHDFVVLTDEAMRELADSGLSHVDPELAGRVVKLAELTLRRSEHHLRRFAEMWRRNRGMVCQLGIGSVK